MSWNSVDLLALNLCGQSVRMSFIRFSLDFFLFILFCKIFFVQIFTVDVISDAFY